MAKKFYNRLQALSDSVKNPFSGGLKGIEKESLRVAGDGSLSTLSHPIELGSALTNNYITTDFSEALLEFVTPASKTTEEVLSNLCDIHQFTYHHLDEEFLWPASMPCHMPPDMKIPLANYGSSNIGQAKTIYRRGLGYRYGRNMQMISGIHFNYSLPKHFWAVYQDIFNDNSNKNNFKSEQYLGLIRNFKRIGWLVLYLFGASPAFCGSFNNSSSRPIELLKKRTHFEPYSTSLRMSDLGYSNQNQSRINISLNNLEEYISDLSDVLGKPEDSYNKIGIKVGDVYRQLNANLLQIENEFYSSIRPKRVAHSGESPTTALRRGGIEYIEIRSLDINLFEPCGIDQDTILFMEVLLIYCLLMESPGISKKEHKDISRNHNMTASNGRDPLFKLMRNGSFVSIKEWAKEILNDIAYIAAELDQHNNGYLNAVQKMKSLVDDPDQTPSAQILACLKEKDIEFSQFALAMAKQHRNHFSSFINKSDVEKFNYYKNEAEASIKRQEKIELSDNISLDKYLLKY